MDWKYIYMNLTELVKYLTNPEKLDALYQDVKVNKESDALLIFMKDALTLDSEIIIIEIEATGGEVLFEKDGIKYVELFPIDIAIELIESDLNLKETGYSDMSIAERLLDYRRRDA